MALSMPTITNKKEVLRPGFGEEISHGKYKSKGNATFMGVKNHGCG